MSIEQLKKILESEREKQRDCNWVKILNDYKYQDGLTELRELYYKSGFDQGDQNATNRLLPLLEKAVKMAEFYADKENWDYEEVIPTIWDNGKIDLGDKALEFLSEFTKMTEIKKESGK